MKRRLTEISPNHIIGMHGDIYGDVSNISADVSNISGDVTGVSGDVTGITGNMDDCEISDEDRKNGININELIA